MVERQISRRAFLAGGSVLAVSTLAGCSSSGDDKEGPDSFYAWDDDPQEDAILYWFWSASCPHCKDMMPFMEELSKRENVAVVGIEVNSEDNEEIFETFVSNSSVDQKGVPLTYIGENQIIGYSEEQESKIELAVEKCIEVGECVDAADVFYQD